MSPIDVQDILERARNSSRVGDHETAEHLLKSYLTKVPDSREARLLLGTTFAKEGKLKEAANEFINLLAVDSSDTEALNNVAVIFRRQGKLAEALEYLNTAIDVNPTKAEFYYNIGNIHKQMGNSKQASMAYSKVIELDPSYVPAYNNLGTIYEQLKEYEKAHGVFRKGLALDSNNPTLRFNYGVSLEATGRLEEAANEYRAALRGKPGWPDPINNLGIVLFKQGRHDKAMATFNRVLSMDPYNAEAHNNMGVVLADQGRTQEAVKNYRRAIEANPRYVKAVVNLERALEASGDFSDAVIELEKLVKLSPNNADIRNRLAGLYLKMERYPEALDQAEIALRWEPESISALRVQGAAQRIMGNDVAAQASFERILSMDPGNYAFLLDLADIHLRRKEYKEAEERVHAYLIRRPGDRAAKLFLGKLYAEMGNRAHAVQVFEELIKTDPNDAEALAAAAELHKKAGSIEKALRTADTLVNLQGKRGTADDLLDLNKSLEFYENAVTAYSTSARDMWDRNMKLMGGEEKDDLVEEDVSLLMGAAGVSHGIEEEPETLFVEEAESFHDEEADGNLVLGDNGYEDILEEIEPPRYRDPLDALAETPFGIPSALTPAAEPSLGAPAAPSPAEIPAMESRPSTLPADSSDSPRKDSTPPPANPMGGTEALSSSVPPPRYPQYPAYPPYGSFPPPPPPPPEPKPEVPPSSRKLVPNEPPLAPPEQQAEGADTPLVLDDELDLSDLDDFSSEEEIPFEKEISAEPELVVEAEDESFAPDLDDELIMSEEMPEDIFAPEPFGSEESRDSEESRGSEELPTTGEPSDFGESEYSRESFDSEEASNFGEPLSFGEPSDSEELFAPEESSSLEEPLNSETPEELFLPELPAHDSSSALDTSMGEEILSNEVIPVKEKNTPANIPAGEIPAVIGLLACLKQMTEALSQEDKNIYSQSKFSKSLESVMDSLKSLTLIGDNNGS